MTARADWDILANKHTDGRFNKNLMARKLNPTEYADRRNEILDAALQLVYTKGYEAMTVQDILDHLGISKGAFYHYFDSKPQLLEALVDRLQTEAESVVLPVVTDPSLNAVEKLHSWFRSAYEWKTDRRDMMIALLRIWYADENAIVRDKMLTARGRRFMVHLTEIVRQGVCEGVFSPIQPEYAGEVLIFIFLGMGETFSRLLLAYEAGEVEMPYIEGCLSAFTEAIERILGAPRGLLQLFDRPSLNIWFARGSDRSNLAGISDRPAAAAQPASP